jgi:hypothetical protein
MRTPRGVVVAALALATALLLLAAAGPAAAQARRASFPRFEVGGGGGAAGAVGLGDRDANLLTNNAAGSPFRLFATATRLRPAAVVEARLGYRATRRLTTEGRLTVGRPQLQVSLSADAENAAPVEAASTLTEYVIEGGAAWRLAGDERRRWIPIVSGGAGVARHVYSGRTLAETSVSGYAGAGTLYALGSARAPAGSRRSGLRFDVRLQMLDGGIAEGAGLSPRVVATASAFVAF